MTTLIPSDKPQEEGVGSHSEKKESKKEKVLSPEQIEVLITTLKARFVLNEKLHTNTQWTEVEKSLRTKPKLMWSLQQLENTGGEPDVIMEDETSFVFGDVSKESPEGRRNVVFDAEAEELVRQCEPGVVFNGNAKDRVQEWGADFMDEEQYRLLQKMSPVDRNTGNWLKTSTDTRKVGRALYGNRALHEVRVNHYSGGSHHDCGGFRCVLRVPKV